MFVKELTKKYDGKAVVDGVSFDIPKRSVISMIGPNGAGKSTVLNILSRLIARDSGLVDLEGQDISRWKSKELAKRLAILTQSNNIQMKLTDDLGKTVILVLHEINYAAFYSDYICAFVDGRVARFGTVREVMNKEVLSKIYNVDFEILEIEGKPLSIYY